MAVLVAVGAVLAAGVSIWALGSGSDDHDGTGSEATALDPRAGEFPAASTEVAEETLAYLEEDGSALLVMHDTAVEVGNSVDSPDCEAVVEDLDRDAPAAEVVGLTARVADEVLAATLAGERTALGVALTACVSGDETELLEDRVTAVAEAADLVEARLAQLQESAR